MSTENKMTLEEWLNIEYFYPPISSGIKEAWDYQQKRIDELEDKQMTEEKAREILGDWIDEDGDIQHGDPRSLGDMDVEVWPGESVWITKSDITPDQLRAIAFWMEREK